MAKLVANSYGEALFELALEKNALDDILQEVECIKKVIEENADFRKFLGHPQISKEEKISVIENIFKKKASNDVVGLLVMIVKKDRYNEMISIFDYFVKRVKEHNNIGVAMVTSAVELDAEQKKKVVDRLIELTKYKEFEISYTVDKSILGGLIIRIGDRVVDSSLKNKLNSMTSVLNKIHIS
jgi:F-type H+-transporting ATPase subunit delta